jgi:FtsP/CotA-like multicopper oxidase with cupredoxin domain
MSSLTQPPGPEPLRTYTLVAEPWRTDGQTVWSFNGTVPGPVLWATQGDRLRVTLVNHLSVSTSVHWHGVAVPNAEDGVAGVTQDAVPPGHTYTYEFVVKQAGTFWYHSHQDTVNQLVQGLFGALVVLPRSGEVADYDYPVVVHEATGANRLAAGLQGLVNLFARAAPAINGQTGDLRLDARAGARVRLRIIGAIEGETDGIVRMNGVPRELLLVGAPYRVVALDGNDLNGPQTIGPERLPIAIGGRYDLEFTMPATGEVRLLDATGGESVTIGSGPRPAVPAASSVPRFDQLAYGLPAADPVAGANHFDVTYPMVLDVADGTDRNTLQLVHTINDQASPMMASYVVREGQLVRLHIVNRTDEYHAMHLHGHSFVVLEGNGRRPAGSPVRLDTLLIGPNEAWDIAFLADNPGLWMFHCHVLIHAAWGMSTMLVYEGVTTPYRLGGTSENKPE